MSLKTAIDHQEAVAIMTRQAWGGGSPARDSLLLNTHVESCTECQDWSHTYQFIAEVLSEEHPSSDRIAHFAMYPSSLSTEDASSIENHCTNCESCRDQLEVTRGAFEATFSTSQPRLLNRTYFYRAALAAVLLLAVTLTWVTRSPMISPDTLASRALVGNQFNGTHLIESEGGLTATGVTVESGGDVTFRAGDSVVLGDGFSIAANADFRIELAHEQNSRKNNGRKAPTSVKDNGAIPEKEVRSRTKT